MNTLEISTMSILHTLSKLNAEDLALLLMISNGQSISQISETLDCNTVEIQWKIDSLIGKFHLSSISDMAALLKEFNIKSMFNELNTSGVLKQENI